MAVDSRVESWSRQLDFHGAIYEVRMPGGALAIADRGSVFSESILESYRFLASTRQIVAIILSCHEDCSYFKLRYDPSGLSRSKEREAQKHILRQAEDIMSEVANGIPVQLLYSKFKSSGDVEHRPIQGGSFKDDAFGSDIDFAAPLTPSSSHCYVPPPAPTTASFHCEPVMASNAPHAGGAQPSTQKVAACPAPAQAYAAPASTSIGGERMTARQLQGELEKHIIAHGGSAERSMIDAASTAEERRVTPAWRVERRLREFLEIVRENGAVKTDAELQRLSLSFANRYGGGRLPRDTRRDLVEDAKSDLGDIRSWRNLRRKTS